MQSWEAHDADRDPHDADCDPHSFIVLRFEVS